MASLMVDTVLTTLSVLEREGVDYTVHQGSLLGAARLQGVLPWDIDGDIAIFGENAETAAGKLEKPLAEHGLAFVFSPEAYYYTIRPLADLPWFGTGRRPVRLAPMIEVILATPSADPKTGQIWQDRHSPKRMFAPGELLPLRRYPWHGSYVMGPLNPEPVLTRLYGAAAGEDALRRFGRPGIASETEAFWRRARPMDGVPDYAAIAARAAEVRNRWRRRAAAAPWYLANGLYNKFIEDLRELAGG